MMSSKLSRRALIVSFRHPYGATEMMADSLAAAMRLNGYQASTAILNSPTFQQDLAAGLSDPGLEVVICTGSWPLKLVIKAAGGPLWRALPDRVLFVMLVIDALPYDFRMPFFVSYLEDYPRRGNLVTVSFERNTAQILGRYTGKKVYYMPTGATLAPILREPPRHPDRLMFWGSIEAELAKNEHTASLRDTLLAANPSGLKASEVEAVADRILHSREMHGMKAVSDALGIPVEEMLREGWIEQLCAIDSALKRHRRSLLIESLRDFPLDVYGKNWERYVEGSAGVRVRTAEPDHNLAFGHICQHYAGVVNIDPNWGEGTNERAVSALSLGVRVATSRNRHVAGIGGCFEYDLTRESIRAACTQALSGPKPAAPIAGFTWEYLVGKLLAEIAADTRNSGGGNA